VARASPRPIERGQLWWPLTQAAQSSPVPLLHCHVHACTKHTHTHMPLHCTHTCTQHTTPCHTLHTTATFHPAHTLTPHLPATSHCHTPLPLTAHTTAPAPHLPAPGYSAILTFLASLLTIGTSPPASCLPPLCHCALLLPPPPLLFSPCLLDTAPCHHLHLPHTTLHYATTPRSLSPAVVVPPHPATSCRRPHLPPCWTSAGDGDQFHAWRFPAAAGVAVAPAILQRHSSLERFPYAEDALFAYFTTLLFGVWHKHRPVTFDAAGRFMQHDATAYHVCDNCVEPDACCDAVFRRLPTRRRLYALLRLLDRLPFVDLLLVTISIACARHPALPWLYTCTAFLPSCHLHALLTFPTPGYRPAYHTTHLPLTAYL